MQCININSTRRCSTTGISINLWPKRTKKCKKNLITDICLLMLVMAKDFPDIVPTTVPNADCKDIDLAKLNGQIVVATDDAFSQLKDFSFGMKVSMSV